MGDPVDEAFRVIRRDGFLPEHQRFAADSDTPLDIGYGQTNSQPRTVADMLRLLDVRSGHRVLDVGAGSGWSTALLGQLTGPTGSVLGVELEPELAAWGAANVRATDCSWARIEPAETDVLGWPDAAPYDRILVSAVSEELPEALIDQLAPEGVLVLPVAGVMTRIRVDGNGMRELTTHGAYRFVPLR